IDHITTIALQSDYQGGLNVDRLMFEKKETEEESESKLGNKKLRTIADKLNYTMDNVINTLKYNIGLYDHLTKTIKDPSKLEKYNEKQKEILKEIEELNSTNQWKAIALYVNSLSNNIYSLNE